MKTFEVTGFGFDGSTDATDDRVFWVKAHSHEEVKQAIAGTKAGFHDTIDAEDSIDFHLPAQASLLKSKLLEFENDVRQMGNAPEKRLEELKALGFDSEADYQEHWRVLQASKALGEKQIGDSIAAGSTAFEHLNT